MYFREGKYTFELTTPAYETKNFGGKVGELRLVNDTSPKIYMYKLVSYLKLDGYLACTFRGQEDINLVRTLNDIGFKFVGTFSNLICLRNMNRTIPLNTDVRVYRSTTKDYNDILTIANSVFDYSTYQMDRDFSLEMMSERNVRRVESYFNNPKHITFVVKVNDKVQGFLQFLVDKYTATCVNGAVMPEYQGLFVGAKLYSDSFAYIFDLGVDVIESGCSNQNISVLKLHRACGFTIQSQEIHLRLKVWGKKTL